MGPEYRRCRGRGGIAQKKRQGRERLLSSCHAPRFQTTERPRFIRVFTRHAVVRLRLTHVDDANLDRTQSTRSHTRSQTSTPLFEISVSVEGDGRDKRHMWPHFEERLCGQTDGQQLPQALLSAQKLNMII